MDQSRWWKSGKDLLTICLLTFLPLILNIAFAYVKNNESSEIVFYEKIVPSELLAYCVTFLSPLFLMLISTHGTSFSLPGLRLIFLIAFLVYIFSLLLIIYSRNEKHFEEILINPEKGQLFWFSTGLLLVAISLRFYTVIQNERFGSFQKAKNEEEKNFTEDFKRRLTK